MKGNQFLEQFSRSQNRISRKGNEKNMSSTMDPDRFNKYMGVEHPNFKNKYLQSLI